MKIIDKKGDLKNSLVGVLAFAGIVAVFVLGIFLWNYYNSSGFALGLGAEIESVMISEDGNSIYVRIKGGSVDKKIESVRFVLTDTEGNKYFFETFEGLVELEVPYRKSFFGGIFGREELEGFFDYELFVGEIEGLESFNGLKDISVVFNYVDEDEKKKSSNILSVRVIPKEKTASASSQVSVSKRISSSSGNKGNTGSNNIIEEGDEGECKIISCEELNYECGYFIDDCTGEEIICEGVCNDGFECKNNLCVEVCEPENFSYSYQCYNNDVYWFDDCGKKTESIKNKCSELENCIEGSCQEITNALEQHGITWFFDKDLSLDGREGTYQYGTFVNGDYWVKTDERGIVNITQIYPNYDYDLISTKHSCDLKNWSTVCSQYHNENYNLDLTNDYVLSCDYYRITSPTAGYCKFEKAKHGWMVNPGVSPQGFDSRVSGFNNSVVPELPYLAGANESIVKSVSFIEWRRPRLESAAVLTILGETPENKGENYFRPPYMGGEKTLYSADSLNLDILPSHETVQGVSFQKSSDYYNSTGNFRGLQLDHVLGASIDYLHPRNNMPNDGGALAGRNNRIALVLMLNESLEEKKPLLYDYVQHGIDLYYAGKSGTQWSPDGQIMVGRILPMTFASVMLNDREMKDFIINAEDGQFQEKSTFYYSPFVDQSLWAMNKSTYDPQGKLYWYELVFRAGGKVGPDPHKYIDGSFTPGITYLISGNAMQAKGISLAVHLMPELKTVLNNPELLMFVDRWATHGIWSQEDPCAPPTGICKENTLNAGAFCTMANSSLCNHTSIQPYTRGLTDCDYTELWEQDYKVKYGLDPNNVGDCIRDVDYSDGVGRVPFAHGENSNVGQQWHSWMESLWQEYRLDLGCIWQSSNTSDLNAYWRYNCSEELIKCSWQNSKCDDCILINTCSDYPNTRAKDYDPCNLGCSQFQQTSTFPTGHATAPQQKRFNIIEWIKSIFRK